MVGPVGEADSAVSLWGKIKSFIKQWGPTELSIVSIDQEWRNGQLIYHYIFRVAKPKHSKSASKSPIELRIPRRLGIAEFDLNQPGLQIEPITIPASKLNVSPRELIGDYLENLHDGEKISLSLRINCASNEVLKFEESEQEGWKSYFIENPNDFPVKSCDIEHTILLTDRIREIEIIKQGVVITQHRLIKLSKTFFVDFEADKIQVYFPKGLSKSDDTWLKEDDETEPNDIRNRTESNYVLRFKLDLDPHDKIEIRLYLM
jgi:hypothetical protein